MITIFFTNKERPWSRGKKVSCSFDDYPLSLPHFSKFHFSSRRVTWRATNQFKRKASWKLSRFAGNKRKKNYRRKWVTRSWFTFNAWSANRIVGDRVQVFEHRRDTTNVHSDYSPTRRRFSASHTRNSDVCNLNLLPRSIFVDAQFYSCIYHLFFFRNRISVVRVGYYESAQGRRFSARKLWLCYLLHIFQTHTFFLLTSRKYLFFM